MNISVQELKQIEEWRTTISNCRKKCEANCGPFPTEEELKNAESAVRLFVSCYAKDLSSDDFPRNNGFFSDDLRTTEDRINKIMSEATIIQVPPCRSIKASPRKRHLPRLKHLTHEFVAGLYNECAQPLIRRRLANGEVVYEPQRGGNRTGRAIFGQCSVSTIKNWIKKHRDASNPHEHNGFHAGLLMDEQGLKKSVRQWKKYVKEYVRQFETWRKDNTNAKRRDFRFDKYTTIHRNY